MWHLTATTALAPADSTVVAQGVLQRVRNSTSIPVENTAHSLPAHSLPRSPPTSQVSLP